MSTTSHEPADAGGHEPGAWCGGRLAAARGGDAGALGELLEGERSLLRRRARRLLAPEQVRLRADSDVVQETFLSAKLHLDQFRGSSRAEWRGWLGSILTNKVVDRKRTRGLMRWPPGDADDSTTAGAGPADDLTPVLVKLIRSERVSQLSAAVALLPELGRQILIHRYVGELSFEAIGSLLGMKADAARKRHDRAIKYLGRLLEGHDRSGEQCPGASPG